MSLQEMLIVAGLLVLVIMFGIAAFARLYRKIGPNEALIRYGIRGTRVVQGGGLIFPMLESCRLLSLN